MFLVYPEKCVTIIRVNFKTFSSPLKKSSTFSYTLIFPVPIPRLGQPLICFLSLWISLFWAFMWSESCSVWSFVTGFFHIVNIVFSRLMHLVVLHSFVCLILFHCVVYCVLLTHSSVAKCFWCIVSPNSKQNPKRLIPFDH